MHKKKELRAHEQAEGTLLLFMNFRKHHALSQMEMAALLAINRSYLGQIEQGKRPITTELGSRFALMQTKLLAKEKMSVLPEENFLHDCHVGDELRARWIARDKYLKLRLHDVQREIENVPDWKLHTKKIKNLGHLVTHHSAAEPINNLIKDKYRILCRTTPLQLQQMKLELEFEAERLTVEMGLIEKYLGISTQGK